LIKRLKVYKPRAKLSVSAMNLTVEIPEGMGAALRTRWRRPPTPCSRMPRIEEYKSERMTKAQLRRLLGFETRYELDDFLKAPPDLGQRHRR
jgi:nucleoside-diphosphate-sugar epimerase